MQQLPPEAITVDDDASGKERTFLIIQPPLYRIDDIFGRIPRQIESKPPLSAEYLAVENEVEELCRETDEFDEIEAFEKINLPKPPVDVKQGWGAPTTSKFERNYLISINDFTDGGDMITNRLKQQRGDAKKTTERQPSSSVFTRNSRRRVKDTQVDEFDDTNW